MKATAVELEVARATYFESRIQRDGQSMGLDLNYSHKSNSLIILSVGEGAVKCSAPEIMVGDRIVAVDGIEGEPEVLLRAIRVSSEVVVLTISRCVHSGALDVRADVGKHDG